jgi:type I restriction enzyme R subunit
MNLNSEDATTEKPALELLEKLGWDIVDAFAETDGPTQELSGRKSLDEVVLTKYLRPALKKLNPDAPTEAIDAAITELQRDRSTMSSVAASQEIYSLIKNGYKAIFLGENDETEDATIRIVDWQNQDNNTFTAISQFWVLGRFHKRRPDILGFINGLPLVHIELKAPGEKASDAYNDNLRDYRDTIPQLFWYNQFIIISNGTDTKLGSTTAPLDHFGEWKRINDEGEVGIISLDTTLRATCNLERALDIIENFVLFTIDEKGRTAKIVAKNHQYIGVNNAVESLRTGQDGRLGVFWHTQGSGKSYSMVFFAQKVLRTQPGNWTFVVITDRLDLDSQIYKNFARAGAVTESEEQARAGDGADLRSKLAEDHRYVFTLIHKFKTPDGAEQPVISERKDIIVMTDEAHRTQYATLALNMRNALPNARFIGFTGTPLIAGETEKTKEVFGDYVSKYNFKQAVDDNATVPLYYENRIPELQLTNENFSEELDNLLEEAELNDEQEKLLERQFARQYHLVTRDDRLERVAKDIVEHFINRGFQGKAMVVSIDKMTAVRTYDKVRKYWQEMIDVIEVRLRVDLDGNVCHELEEQLVYMRETDMAVIISQSQNEVDDFRAKGLDIWPHRERMVKEDLEENFKKPEHNLRIVFVCAMWITGFDAPAVSTIYLDKPMQGHTLMQTIARANRVFTGKTNGLIVDYIGVFRDLQKALSVYGQGTEGEMPVREKSEMISELRNVLSDIREFFQEATGHSLDDVQKQEGFERVAAIERTIDAVVSSEDSKKAFEGLANAYTKLFKAILPDPSANEFLHTYQLLRTLQGQIRALAGDVSIDHVSASIEELLDESIEAGSYTIKELQANEVIDLSRVDFDKLQQQFGLTSKNIQTEKLKNEIDKRLKRMLELNKTRMELADKFQKLIDEYNAGSKNIEEFFNELLAFAKELDEEDQRAVREEMTEEELIVFDLIVRPGPELSQAEIKQVKMAARDLLASLKQQKLVLDWKKSQQNRAIVQRTIRDVLHEELPNSYDTDWQQKKLSTLYEHFYESYEDVKINIYEAVL